MTQLNILSPTATTQTGRAIGDAGNLSVLVAQSNNPTGKPYDSDLALPVVAPGPDKLNRQVTVTRRLYPDGDMRYYVGGVPLGQQFKTEAAARAEVVRRVAAGTLGSPPLAPRQQPAQQTRRVVLPGDNGVVEGTAYAGQRSVVQLQERQELRNGRWQVTGYIATKVSTFSIQADASSRPRTPHGYPLESQDKSTLILAANGGVITDLAQAHRRTRELVAARALTTVSAAEAKAVSDARPLPKAIGAMGNLDRVKYLLHETLRQLPASAGNELRAMLTSPETWAVMGAFLVAGAVPGLNVAAMVVGALLLGNDALDTGGKMVDAVRSALDATSQADLVNAGKQLGEALVHSAVMVASPVIGKRVGQAINTSWKAGTTADAIALRNFNRNVELRNKGQATDKQVGQAAVLLVQTKRASAASNATRTTPPTPPPQSTSAQTPAPATTPANKPANTSRSRPDRTTPEPARAQAAEARAVVKASEGVFTDRTLQTQLAERLAKDPRTNPSKNATASIDPMVVQAFAQQLLMPKLLRSFFDGRNITKTATDAVTARATAWAKQESPSNPAGALERLVSSPALRQSMVKATVIDQLTGSSVVSMKALGASQPIEARALSGRRQRLSEALDRAYPDPSSQAKLLERNAGSARTALLREQAGIELGGSTPMAAAVQAHLKAKGTGERDLTVLSSNPKVRISTMTNALVGQWRGSSGKEPLLDGKSQRALRKAIDSQLARIPGDVAKQQYLKDLAASGQTVARMAGGEADAGTNLRKVPKAETTVSQGRAPSAELANKSAIPSTLKSVPGGFEINLGNLTRNQEANYQRLRVSGFTAAEVNDITSTVMKSGVVGLAKNPKYLNLSADNLACLMHLINGLDSTAALHDVTHTLLSSPKFRYGVSEWRENVGNTVANSFIVAPKEAFSPFSWVPGADGTKTLRIDASKLSAARQELSLGSSRYADRAFEFNFAANARNRTRAAVERSVGEINFMEGRGASERYQDFRARVKDTGQWPDSPPANFEQNLVKAYGEFEAKVLATQGTFSQLSPDHDWVPVLQPIVKVLTQPALAEYRRVPAATRREMAVDSISSVLTANKFYSKIDIPRGTNTARFNDQWVEMDTSDMTRSGYLKAYLEVRELVTKALADDAKP